MRYRTFLPVVLLLPTLAFAQPKPGESATKEDDAAKAQLDRRLPEFRVDGVALEDVVDFLRDVTGANVFVDWRAVEKAGIQRTAPVTLRQRDVPFRTALDKVVESVSTPKAKLAWATDGRVIVLSSADAATNKGGHVTGQVPADVDKRLPEVRFDAVAFSDTIDFLRDASGVNLFVNWNELEKAGIKKDSPVTLRLREEKLSTALRLVLLSAGDGSTPVQITHVDRVVTITTGPKPADGGK
jgi:hypothetical protein